MKKNMNKNMIRSLLSAIASVAVAVGFASIVPHSVFAAAASVGGNLSVGGTIGHGILITQLLGNFDAAGPTSSGYFNMITNYVPPVNATAFTFNRCSLSTKGAGQTLTFRSAIRTPTGAGGTERIGNAFFLFPSSANTETIFGENNDFFTLTAGHSYDFGMDLDATAGGQLVCSTVVQIFSR